MLVKLMLFTEELLCKVLDFETVKLSLRKQCLL